MVELLVGVAVGLLVVAAAAMVTATQLADNRRLLLETQVQQDLRAAVDTVTREVRRSGARLPAEAFVWTSAADGSPAPGGLDDAPITGAAGAMQVNFRYNRFDFPGGQAGFRQNAGRLQFRLTTANTWSDLTDTKAVTIGGVGGFVIAANHQIEPTPPAPDPQRIPCPNLCPVTNDTSCWPVLRVRQFNVSVSGTAVSDPAVRRNLQAIVKPRNDQLVTGVAAPNVCPP